MQFTEITLLLLLANMVIWSGVFYMLGYNLGYKAGIKRMMELLESYAKGDKNVTNNS